MVIPFAVIPLPQGKLTAVLDLDNPVGVALLHGMDGASTWQVS